MVNLIIKITAGILLLLMIFPLELVLPTGGKPNLSSAEYAPPAIVINKLVIFFGLTIVLAILSAKFRGLAAFRIPLWLERILPGLLLLLITTEIIFLSHYCFNYRPHLVDSLVQFFQGKIFSGGTLVAKHPELLKFFVNQHYVYHAGNWSGQYPPAHSALLAVGMLLGNAQVALWGCAVCSAYSIYRITQQLFGKGCARISLLLLSLCPFFLVMSASYMNHVSSLFFLSAFVYYLVCYAERSEAKGILIAAGFAGLGFINRPYSAFLVGLALAPLILAIVVKRKDYLIIALAALIFAAVAALWPVFNLASTGSALLPGYISNWGDSHNLGFHSSPWGDAFTLLVGIKNQVLNFIFGNSYFFENLIPSFLPLLVWLIFARALSRWERQLLLVLAVYVAGHVFYWHTDFFLGPRFWYALLIVVIPLTARALVVLYDWTREKALFGVDLRRLYLSGSLILIVYFFAFGLPHRASTYHEGLSSFKRAPDFSFSSTKKLVFVKVSWGSRVISKLRGAGVSASLTETAYRKISLCALAQILSSSNTYNLLEQNLLSELERKRPPVIKIRLTNDSSTRIYQGEQISDFCREQLEYDLRSNFTIYAPHFVLNDAKITKNSNLIIAKDLREENLELIREFSDHEVYFLDSEQILRAEK